MKKIQSLVNEIYIAMTSILPDAHSHILESFKTINTVLPEASTNKLNGIIETLIAPTYNGRVDLPYIAEHADLALDGLLPVLELMQILKFATVEEGDVILTVPGRLYAEADIDGRKKLFAEHIIENIPLAKYILTELKRSKNKKLNYEGLLAEIKKNLSKEMADKLLITIINYGRYAEIFYYDDSSRIFYLEKYKLL